MREQFKWPPRSRLAFYRRTKLLFAETDRELDLSDTLMGIWPYYSRTVYMGISSRSTRWKSWTEEKLQKIEDLIRYDLDFDGYRVTITRLTEARRPCTKEFLWKLRIRTRGL